MPGSFLLIVFLQEKHKSKGGGKIKKMLFPHRRGGKKQVPGYLLLHKTKSKLLHGEKMYIHLAVTVQAVAIPLKNQKYVSLLSYKTKAFSVSFHIYLALCVIYKSHCIINYNLINNTKK